jgi:phage tail-like protein
MAARAAALTADARASLAHEAARFSLTIDGVEIAAFSQLDDVTPGRFVLERGTSTRSKSLFAWHQSVVEGQIAAAKRDGVLAMYDANGKPVARYHLTDAWPSKLEIGALKANGIEVSVEGITLCHEGFEIR